VSAYPTGGEDGGRYRPLQRSDCDALASHYNRNLLEPDPIWCAQGGESSATSIWLHRLVLVARGRGQAISQVHEQAGRTLSYFGGYHRHGVATFSIGIVDLDLPDPMATWRRDTAHLFGAAVRDGAEAFRIHSSSDRGRFVGWLEDEVGARRVEGRNVWAADRADVARYAEEARRGRGVVSGGRGYGLDPKKEELSRVDEGTDVTLALF
jgi:hypothetical protein